MPILTKFFLTGTLLLFSGGVWAVGSDNFEGTASLDFILNSDNEPGDVALVFGSGLTQYLQWNAADGQFEFGAALKIQGDLNVTGDLNLNGGLVDANSSGGTLGQVLASDGAGGSVWQNNSVDETPYINSSTTKRTVAINSPATLTIYGGGFTPNSTVTIPGFDGVIGTPNVISPEEIEVLVTPGATEASYDLVISNGSISNTVWPNNGEDLLAAKNLTILVPGVGGTAWNNQAVVTVTGGAMVPSNTTSGWSKGASFGTAPANTDFTLSFDLQYMTGQSTGGYAMFGVDNSDPNQNYNTIDYAIYLQNGSNVYIYENGSNRGLQTTFVSTDSFSIERLGTTITYLKNGTAFYTSTVASSAAMVFDSSIYRYLGAKNLSLSY